MFRREPNPNPNAIETRTIADIYHLTIVRIKNLKIDYQSRLIYRNELCCIEDEFNPRLLPEFLPRYHDLVENSEKLLYSYLTLLGTNFCLTYE